MLVYTMDRDRDGGLPLEAIAWSGDSGGPAFIERSGDYYIAGINSSGDCCSYGDQDEYTRLGGFAYNWIQANIENSDLRGGTFIQDCAAWLAGEEEENNNDDDDDNDKDDNDKDDNDEDNDDDGGDEDNNDDGGDEDNDEDGGDEDNDDDDGDDDNDDDDGDEDNDDDGGDEDFLSMLFDVYDENGN